VGVGVGVGVLVGLGEVVGLPVGVELTTGVISGVCVDYTEGTGVPAFLPNINAATLITKITRIATPTKTPTRDGFFWSTGWVTGAEGTCSSIGRIVNDYRRKVKYIILFVLFGVYI
jgi:hypothetical protein